MKKRTIFIILFLLIALISLSAFAIAKSRPKEVFLDGVEQEDGTVLYESDDGMYAVVGDW